MTDRDRYADSVGAYLLGALDDDERVAFEAHLAGCAECRDEVEFLRVASDALPASAPQIDPPPELKDRIMAVVRAEAELLHAAGASADRPPERTSWWRRLWAERPLGLAVAAAVVLGLGVTTGVLLNDADRGPAATTIQAKVEAEGADAWMKVSEDRVELIAENLPHPGRDRVYQVWIKRPGEGPQPTDALFTTGRDGSASVDVPGSLEGVEAVLVTSEPEGGSPTPTRAPIIEAAPA